MSVQQFCLRWNNHQPNFISVFSTLLHNESLVDVTLAAEGRHLQAHKVVLSACSSYFQTLFTVNPCQHPIVILKDVKYMDLKIMVDFMYYGEVNVSQEQLPHILKTAEMLKIKGLAEMPDSTSLTKSHSASSERADILTPGDSTWGSDTHRHSPSPAPLSPNSKRKRLRKSSTGSTSLSTERCNSEEQVLIQSTTSDANSGLIRSNKHTASTDSDNQQPFEGSHEIHENNRLIAQKSTESESSVSVVQTLGVPMVDMAGPPISGNCPQQAPQPDRNQQSNKRGRVLIRQPRIKNKSDSASTSAAHVEHGDQTSPALLSVSTHHSSISEAPTSYGSPHHLSYLTVPHPAPGQLLKQHSHPLLRTVSPPAGLMHRQLSHPPSLIQSVSQMPLATSLRSENDARDITQPPMAHQQRSISPSIVIVNDPPPSQELRRSESSPQNFSLRDMDTTSNTRSSHCPAVRPGPALGCNFCWNTIDAHGRILRRKTKYHCPECQTNLCIVPCFQEYHERQEQDVNKDDGNKTSSDHSNKHKLIGGSSF
ncbi:protein abrupt isoform X1 [Ctenocephalides felis]|uniref:protein abrupt isoform X1 n=1 Tax=Ctenocephalides felis TaxID=7515 RepID=UPI000E6E104E|nr:protein abrupt isoform X1 [Ctenocephalides felis]